MTKKLSEIDILSLLGDGYDSDIGSIDDETEELDFPNDEFQNLLNDFEEIHDELNEVTTNIHNNPPIVEPNIIYNVTEKKNITWHNEPYIPPKLHLDDIQENICSKLRFPIEYFLDFFDETFFEEIAFNTTLYSVQNSVPNFKATNSQEIKQLIAIHLIMGSLKYPRAHMYWEDEFRVSLICNTMTRNRFFQLRSNLHIINNESIPLGNKDKFIKVRPLYDLIKKKCNSLPKERNLSIDEQMVPFKGHLSVKQYMKGKPCPWGIKIFILAGESGIVYDFIIYQGATTEFDESTQKKLGLGGAVVLYLTKTVKENSHYLFFDNYFSSFQLFEQLYINKIYAIGTIRANRFNKPPLLSDKVMGKMGRGTTYEIRSSKTDNGCSIALVKWFDNKPVNMASNYLASGVIDEVKRYDKKEKVYVTVERPEIVRLYNKSMGGVDKIDQLISFYRIFIKSKKWTMRLIMHAFDLVVSNCWLIYKNDAKQLNTPQNKVLDLLHFRLQLARELIEFNFKKKAGRPKKFDADFLPKTSPSTTKKPRTDSVIPPEHIRYDRTNHFPEVDQLKNPTKCKYPPCENRHRTHVRCIKCDIHLCLNSDRNCFLSFHKSD